MNVLRTIAQMRDELRRLRNHQRIGLVPTMRVSKAFNLGGRKQLVALWEAFNIFNTINYTTFGTTKYNAVSSTYDATANKAVVNLASNTGFAVPTTASNTLFGPRDMQIGFRFLW